MPIKRLLKGRNFSPESEAILVNAFHSVVADLDLRTIADREKAAKIVSRPVKRLLTRRSSATEAFARCERKARWAAAAPSEKPVAGRGPPAAVETGVLS